MTCNRFDTEGLEALERGEPLGEHFLECEDCLAARQSYDAMLGSLRTAIKADAPADLPERVRSQIAEEGSPPGSRVGLWVAGLAACLVLAVTLAIQSPADSVFTSSVRSTDQVTRGSTARVGDTVVFSATRLSEPQYEIRIYDESGSLFARCALNQSCDQTGRDATSLIMEHLITGPGKLQPVLYGHRDALPASTGNLDQDLAQAITLGISVNTLGVLTAQ